MIRTALVFLATTLLCLPAAAQVVDFEDIAVGPTTNDIGGDRVSGGFLFDTFTNHSHLVNDVGFAPDNGTTFVIFDDFVGVNQVIMRQSSGQPFALSRVDLTQADQETSRATDVMFTGQYAVGGNIQQTFDIAAAANTWATYQFTGNWTGLDFVEIQGLGATSSDTNYYGIDNIHLVPEPGCVVAALLACLVATAAPSRRRTQR